jgi:antitoxin ParD1/3/4
MLMSTKSPTMNVSLTDALRDVVDERLRSGLYGNASEYVRELIRRDEESARQLRALYQAGIDSGESVPMSDGDWAALRAVARSPAFGQA